MVSTCAAITEISAPVHNCTGNAFSASYPNGTQATPQCVLDWSSDSDLVRFWDPVYSGPLDEYCPYGCDETRSPGQYSCSGDCEVNPAGTTCTGAPFLCRPPRMTSAELNFTRCFDATDALSCASMQSDDDDTGVPLGCIGISTVRMRTFVPSFSLHRDVLNLTGCLRPDNAISLTRYAAASLRIEGVTTAPAQFKKRKSLATTMARRRHALMAQGKQRAMNMHPLQAIVWMIKVTPACSRISRFS